SRNDRFLSRFFNYIYKGEIEVPVRTIEVLEAEIETAVRTIEVLEAEIETVREGQQIEANQQLTSSTSSRKKIVSDLVLRINKVLTFVCIGSFILMAIYVFVYPDKPIPDIFQNAFFSTLGWFGSAFANFFQVDKEN
ncbi:MAG: hypothetical protein AB4372_39990, partial [Xenococcus sp. (in: cyanobacteria)]